MLRIHTDRSLVPPGEPHVTLLYPFWGRAEGIQLPRPDFADKYATTGGRMFELVSLEDADVAVFPVDWRRIERGFTPVENAHVFAERARSEGKRAVFFYVGDSTRPLPLENAVVARTSLVRSRRRANELPLAALHEDLLEYVGALPVREWTPRPRIGFCGFVFRPDRLRMTTTVKRVVFEHLGRPLDEDVFVRHRALEALERQSEVDAEVVVRPEGTYFPDLPLEKWRQRRLDYVDNLVRSDYALVARGAGNFSFRFSEVLSLGRIPVFVDTDCMLPFDDEVGWHKHCIWVERRDISRIGERVAEFHATLVPGEFEERQRTCRRLWEEYLSPEGFFKHFARQLRTYA
jgi:hypothetical protein